MKKVQVTLEFNSIDEAQSALTKLGGGQTATVSATGSSKEEAQISNRMTKPELEDIANARGIDTTGMVKQQILDALEGKTPAEPEVKEQAVVESAPVETAPAFDKVGTLKDIRENLIPSLMSHGLKEEEIGSLFEGIYSELQIKPVKIDSLDDASLSKVHASLNGKLQERKAAQSQGHTPSGPSFI